MEYPWEGGWQMSLPYWVLYLVVLQLLGEEFVAKGEFLHKNNTESEDAFEGLVQDAKDSIVDPHIPKEEDDKQGNAVIRCHCNLPVCVRNGYMCKSTVEGGACFTRYTTTPAWSNHDVHTTRPPMHGCVELLMRDLALKCQRLVSAAKANISNININIKSNGIDINADSKKNTNNSSIKNSSNDYNKTDEEIVKNNNLSCCQEDMCNFENLDIYIQIDRTYIKESKNPEEPKMTESVWFRAAIIAVPIAGGFILVILVLLATKMLTKENKRNRMAQVLSEQRYLKAPLYPGESCEPLPHHSYCYHHPSTSSTSTLMHSSSQLSPFSSDCHPLSSSVYNNKYQGYAHYSVSPSYYEKSAHMPCKVNEDYTQEEMMPLNDGNEELPQWENKQKNVPHYS